MSASRTSKFCKNTTLLVVVSGETIGWLLFLLFWSWKVGPRMLFLVMLELDVVSVGCMMGWMEKLYVILM